MFGDFMSLCFDQVLNHITKFQAMYDGQVTCPVIMRSPMGGGRAYGATHSQSLEKYYLGVPGLTVVAASLVQPPDPLFDAFLAGDSPILFVEHKMLYGQECRFPTDGRCGRMEADVVASPGFLPTVFVRPVERSACCVTILAYGQAATVAVDLAESLALEREIFVEVVVPAQIAPMDWAALESAVAGTGRVVICEEGTAGWNWGSEVAAELCARLHGRLSCPVYRVSSDRATIPSSKTLEGQMLLGRERVLAAIQAILT